MNAQEVLRKIELYTKKHRDAKPGRDNPSIRLDTLMLDFKMPKDELIHVLMELEGYGLVTLVVNDLAKSKRRASILGTVTLL